MAALSVTQVSFLAGVCFLGGMAGTVVASTARQPAAADSGPVARPAAPERAAATAEVLDEIRALRRELDRDSADRNRVEVEAAPATAANDADLRRRMAALETSLTSLLGPSVADATKRPPLRTVHHLSQIVANWEVDLESQRLAERRLDEEHRLWSISRVIEHYGMPNKMQGDGGVLSFHYATPGNERTFYFQFASGVVFNVNFM